jgi:DNA-binding MarR family transcriptional regulator
MGGREAYLDAIEGLLLRLGRRVRGRLAEEDLTLPQLVLLRELYLQGRLAMTQAAEALGMSPAAATGSVDRLVRKGWVRRYRSEEDRRLVWVEATAVARERLEALQHERRRQLGALLGALDEGELDTLVALLTRVVDRAQAAEEEHGRRR